MENPDQVSGERSNIYQSDEIKNLDLSMYNFNKTGSEENDYFARYKFLYFIPGIYTDLVRNSFSMYAKYYLSDLTTYHSKDFKQFSISSYNFNNTVSSQEELFAKYEFLNLVPGIHSQLLNDSIMMYNQYYLSDVTFLRFRNFGKFSVNLKDMQKKNTYIKFTIPWDLGVDKNE